MTKVTIKRPKFAEYQNRVLYNEHRITVTEAATKVGKTFSHLFWLFELAHGGNNFYYFNAIKSGMNFWWVAPVYSQAEIAYKRMKRKIARNPLYRTNDSERYIVTPFGSVITFKTADKPDNLYGEDVYGVVFDEFTRAKRAAWVALRSTITATKAPIKLIGNFIDSYNWGHLMVKNDKKGIFDYHVITAWEAVDAGILDREEVENAKDTLTEDEFNKLYLCKGEGDNALTTLNDILELWSNDFVSHGSKSMVVDVAGNGKDKFVVAIFSGLRMIHYEIHDKTDGFDIVAIMKRLKKRFKIKNHNIIFDSIGVGHAATGWFKGAYEFKSNLKPIRNRTISHEGKKKEVSDYKDLRDDCAFKLADCINELDIFIECKMSQEVMEIIQQELGQLRTLVNKNELRQLITKDEIKDNIGRSPDWMDVFIMLMITLLRKKKTKSPTQSATI